MKNINFTWEGFIRNKIEVLCFTKDEAYRFLLEAVDNIPALKNGFNPEKYVKCVKFSVPVVFTIEVGGSNIVYECMDFGFIPSHNKHLISWGWCRNFCKEGDEVTVSMILCVDDKVRYWYSQLNNKILTVCDIDKYEVYVKEFPYALNSSYLMLNNYDTVMDEFDMEKSTELYNRYKDRV